MEDVYLLVGELRSDMSRQFADVNRQFGDVHRQLIDVRTETHRDFRWVVGIQLTTMAAVIGALVSVASR